MGAPVVVVVAGGEVEHSGGELVGEGGSVLGGAEADLGVDGHGGEALAGRLGPAGETADLSHQATGERDEVAGRQPIRGEGGIHGGLPESGGRDDGGGGGGPP